MYQIYDEIEPYNTHFFKVDDLHTIYVEESGNVNGIPIIMLHGGPGGHSTPFNRRLANPEKYRIIQFDQRGCGKSTPFASLEKNTTQHLIADMEFIRHKLAIHQWVILGGSWGTTLALHYAINFSQNVLGLVLRGVFLGRQEDVDWLYQKGASDFYPENFEKFVAPIDKAERHEIVNAYYKIFHHADEKTALEAAKAWFNWENGLVTLIPKKSEDWNEKSLKHALSLAKLECHYFYHHCFVEDDNYILNHVHKIAHLPIYMVHGRYDVDCRPIGAFELHRNLKHSQLMFINDAGHAQSEFGIANQLRIFTDQLFCQIE